MAQLQKGDAAPGFSTPDKDGRLTSLSDFKKNWVVLYFYPKDMTPGCTIEGIEFTKLLPKFKKLNAVVIGVSADPPESHCRFAEKHKLGITLLSDVKKKMVEDYGVWGMKLFMGKSFLGIKRSTFIIDPKGVIQYAEYGVKAEMHAEAILKTLQELQ